ncbi:MAG: hypothetical protein KF883_06490 [Thermomicrobiales bacterium]|nr:hypothetical protein [Thermomicrobiales bacterium]
MEPSRFDRITKQLAERRVSRRQALAQGGAGLAAASLAALSSAEAQDAADPATPGKVPFLFVQTYQSGTIVPTEGVEDRYTLSLQAGHGQTIYFSDRPDRVVGASPTPEFLEGLGFLDDNPPNAALVVETAPGETDVAVVELFSPIYDPVSQGVTYEIEVLENWQSDLGMEFEEAPTDLATLAPAFGAAHLFIDDCPNSPIYCVTGYQGATTVGVIKANVEMCWNYMLCQPCEPYGHTYPDHCAAWRYWKQMCDSRFGARCGDGGCSPSWSWPFKPTCF